MKLSEYDDADLLKEVKHRGLVIEIRGDFTSENRIGYIANIPLNIVVKS